MYNMYRLILVTLAKVCLYECIPLNCTKFCEKAEHYAALSPCKCPVDGLAAKLLLPEQEVDETAIYYEPSVLKPGPPELYLHQPFYIVHPSNKLTSLHKDRESTSTLSKRTAESTNIIQNDDSLALDKGVIYLDIGLDNKFIPSDSKNIKVPDLSITENDLLDCLDLHIIVLSRKSGDVSKSQNILESRNLVKYETLSDSDIAVAIDSKCSKPIQLIKQSLTDIKASLPKKSNTSSPKGDSILKIRQMTEVMKRLNYSSENPSTTYPEKESVEKRNELRDNDKQTGNIEIIGFKEPRYVPKKHVTTENDTLFNYLEASTITSNNETSANTDRAIVEDDSLVDNETSGTDLMPNVIPSEFLVFGDNRSSHVTNDFNDLSKTTEYVIKVTTFLEHDTFDPSINISDEVSPTTDINYNLEFSTAVPSQLEEPDLNSRSIHKDLSESLQDLSIIKDTKNITDSLKSKDLDKTGRLGDDKYIHKNISEIIGDLSTSGEFRNITDFIESNNLERRNSLADNIFDSTNRSQVEEKDVQIPRIVSKELINGSVISDLDGFEELPNNDFENITFTNEPLAKPKTRPEVISVKETSIDTSAEKHYNDLTGHLYFMFDKYFIPARFIQNPEGEISVGIDGVALCEKLLASSEKKSNFLLKLCS